MYVYTQVMHYKEHSWVLWWQRITTWLCYMSKNCTTWPQTVMHSCVFSITLPSFPSFRRNLEVGAVQSQGGLLSPSRQTTVNKGPVTSQHNQTKLIWQTRHSDSKTVQVIHMYTFIILDHDHFMYLYWLHCNIYRKGTCCLNHCQAVQVYLDQQHWHMDAMHSVVRTISS